MWVSRQLIVEAIKTPELTANLRQSTLKMPLKRLILAKIRVD